MEPQDSPTSTPPSKGYGKRPKWQWLVIYLVVAVIVYGLVYLLFMRGDDGGSSVY
jgi:hypothetical protein